MQKSLSAKTLTGLRVKNLEGEDIGEIQDLMLDLENGRIIYTVLSFGGFLGMGDKYFAIPMEALMFDPARDNQITLDVDKEVLENAPGFDKNDWPATPSQEYVQSVYEHYGYSYRPTSYDTPT